MSEQPRRPLRIAAMAGAIGDHAGAVNASINTPGIDVVIGDYMAEFTMARVLAGLQAQNPPLPATVYSYHDFVRLIAPELETIAARGIKIVVNAGVYDPPGLTAAVRAAIAERGLKLKVAYTQGDDLFPRLKDIVAEGRLTHLDTGLPPGALADRMVAANAYMGGWGIAAALSEGADIVICGRVSDASLVLGPAAWWHNWARDDWDKLAAAVAAGHIIECGGQATGGNFAGFLKMPRDRRVGYPIAEIEADGQVIITKREDEGGMVTVDTVTAQLLYEIQGPHYLNPDVILHMDSVELLQDAPDRVRLRNVKGSPAPETTKLGCFYMNGWRSFMWAFAVGLDAQAKIDWLEAQLRTIVSGLKLDEFKFEVCGRQVEDPQTLAEASLPIRLSVAAQDKAELAKFVSGYASFALGGIPAFHGDGGGPPEMRVEFWPGLIDQREVHQQVVLEDGRVLDVALPPLKAFKRPPPKAPRASGASPAQGSTRRAPLGDILYARSGDKGADANLGIWCRDAIAWPWVQANLNAESLRRLLGVRQDVAIEVHEMENVRGLMIVMKGYFGASGSGNIGLDPIGKGVGEFLRARVADIPAELLPA